MFTLAFQICHHFFFGGGWHKLNGLSPNDTESKYFVDTIFKNNS
jgi:hypothetical protein